MSEAPIAKAVELRRHRRRRLIPAHPSIHATVCLSRVLAMAFCNKSPWPISPSSARPGCLDALHVQRRKRRREMKPVIRIAFACFQPRQIPNNFAHRLNVNIFRRRWHFDFSKNRRDQNHALPKLREAVLWALHYLMAHMIAKIVESFGKPREHLLVFELRNILHRDQLRMSLANETRKFIQQKPPFVSPCRLLVVLGKRLAWCASGKKRDMVLPKIFANLFCRDFRNRLVQKLRMIVMLVRILATFIIIDAHTHIYASLSQSTSKSPATAEQIYGVNSICLGLSFPTHDQLPWRQYKPESSIRLAQVSIFAEAN